MHLRRALLLFAIVLGLAAIATSLSRPPESRDEPATDTAQAPAPSTGGEPATARFPAEGEPRLRRVPAGRAATVTVAVSEPGQVTIPGLGLSAPAEPLTPARLDVFAPEAADYEVRFTPAGEGAGRTVGTLEIVTPS